MNVDMVKMRLAKEHFAASHHHPALKSRGSILVIKPFELRVMLSTVMMMMVMMIVIGRLMLIVIIMMNVVMIAMIIQAIVDWPIILFIVLRATWSKCGVGLSHLFRNIILAKRSREADLGMRALYTLWQLSWRPFAIDTCGSREAIHEMITTIAFVHDLLVVGHFANIRPIIIHAHVSHKQYTTIFNGTRMRTVNWRKSKENRVSHSKVKV